MANGLLDYLSGFGSTPPEYLGGLLGQEAVDKLKGRAATTGLANAVLGYLAAPKNQNLGLGRIIGQSLQAGMQGAQGVYDTATQDYLTQQKIAEMQRKQKQQAAEDLFRTRIGQPNATRDVVTQDTMQVPVAQGTEAPSFQTQLPAPTVTKQQYFDPKVMINEALQSGALPFEKYLELMAKEKTDSPFGKVDPAKFTQDSILKFTTTGRYEDLQPIENEKGFGAGTAGASLNLLTKGSLNTSESTKIRSSPDYALAWREVTKPQTVQTEEMDDYGNVRVVTRQVPAPPLPSNILPPIYSQQSADALNAPAPSPTSNKSNVRPTQNVPTDNAGQPSLPAGIKSSPLTRSQTELGKYREKIDSAEQLQLSLNDLVDFTKKNKDPALWGVGEVGGELASKYEDVLTQLRIAAELGVLNKEDLPRLMKQLPNPTDLQTWIKGGGTLSSFYGATKAQNAKLTRDINQWSKYVNPNAKQNAAPPSASTEQDIAKQILEERKKAQKGSNR
jgi:hypothetical protein